MIGPVFASLSVHHPSLVFLTVDVDANEVRLLHQQLHLHVNKALCLLNAHGSHLVQRCLFQSRTITFTIDLHRDWRQASACCR